MSYKTTDEQTIRDLVASELRTVLEHPHMLEYQDTEQNYLTEADTHIITPDADYGKMQPLLTFHGVPCMPRRELVAITGKTKCGKTIATSLLMSAAMWGGNIMGFEATEGLLRILYVDTEQAEYSTQMELNRVLKMSTLPYQPERLQILNLRRESYEYRRLLIEAKMSQMHPDLVIIDGIRDLLLDFNDIAQSMELINHLMTLSVDFDCCIVCILHQNKPKDDNNMRGHLGSELENKSAEVYELSREERVFCFSQKLSRNESFTQDLKFEVYQDADGCALPKLFSTEVDTEPVAAIDTADYRAVMNWIFAQEQHISYARVKSYMSKLGICRYADTARLWKEALANGHIVRAGSKDYILAPQSNQPIEQELPIDENLG